MPAFTASPPDRAVLTGDLIGSRKHTAHEIDASLSALENAAASLGEMFEFDPRFTRHRGDGWQIYLPTAKHCLKACLGLRAALLTLGNDLDTRIAVGVGSVERLGTKDLSDAAGEAFEISGTLLDRMSRKPGHETMMIAGPLLIDKWPQSNFALSDWISRRWTPYQAEAVAMVLLDTDYDTNERRAKALGISRQAFDARLKGSGLEAMYLALGAFQAKAYQDAQA